MGFFGKKTETEDMAPEIGDETGEDEFIDEEPAIDWRADGPFDISEVDLGDTERLDLGSLIVTGFPGLNLQLRVNDETKAVESVLAVWKSSALELTLYAASGFDDAVADRLNELADKASAAGGEVSWESGVFGPELQQVLPTTSPKGKQQQKVQVARTWLVEGPKWLLQGTLLGEAGMNPTSDPQTSVFVEFFRNLVVSRGNAPLAPGAPIPMQLPEKEDDGKK